MDKVLGMLGMAKRAGRVTSGAFLCGRAVREGLAQLVIIAKDISENGKKDIIGLCSHYQVQYIEYADKLALGNSIGASERAVVSVNDRKFADAILAKHASAQ